MKLPRPRVSQATRDEIAEHRKRYASLFDEIDADIREFVSTGSMSRAKQLAAATGQHLNHNQYPMYFTGDLDASLVLVHLNPKQDDDASPRYAGPLPVQSFEDYFDVFRNWGARFYGVDSEREFKSRFDRKQIRFLRPFGTIDFDPEDTGEAAYRNLERVCDHKLQMELIPYGSATFSSAAFSAPLIEEHFDRVLRVITARPRKYVLFCGAVFEPLIRDFVVGQPHRFNLTKKDGTPEAMTSEFANLSIPVGSTRLTAGWCRSWARQGIPMESYANEVLRRYERPDNGDR